MYRVFLILVSLLALAGCDQLGIESATQMAERKTAEGKAIGGACRQGGRGIEDCYVLNKKADKAAVYAGWREMDDYMRENKLDAMAPTLSPQGAAAPEPAASSEAADAH
ncbi:MAG: hypothetical protein LCH73_11785 [Proteobacteria bacterium]|nr:hypothetical protein [Pseudomonadota bacterium]